MPKVIDGIRFKELFCKNDSCRAHLGYEKVKRGAVAFICRKCKQVSIYRINYGRGEENMDTLIEVLEEKGGE